MSKDNQKLFEDNLIIINQEIFKRKTKWTLTSIPSISFEDVAQILRIHIFNKIHLYNDKKSSIECWLNAVITNQLRNLLRNLYMNFNKPCISCSCAEDETGCRLYGEQCDVCPLFKHWVEFKQQAYNTKLPLPMENHQQESYDLPHQSINVEATADNIHAKMKELLKPMDYEIYNLSLIHI